MRSFCKCTKKRNSQNSKIPNAIKNTPFHQQINLLLTAETPSLTLGNIKANGTATTSTTVSSGASLPLTANVSASNGTLSYCWSTSQGGSCLNTTSSYTPTVSANTTYWLRVTNTTAGGCSTYEDKSIDVTVQSCNLNPTLSFNSSTYSGGTNANIPVQVSVGTLDGGNDDGYTWSITSSNASSASLNAGSYSYQKNFVATAAGTYTIKCVMHVTKGSCEADAEATATVTVSACNVTINSLSFDRPSGAYGYSYYPVQLNAKYSVSPSNASLSWNWNRYSSNSYSLTASDGYFLGSTRNYQNCYILTSNATTLYYGVTLTATYGGCSVSKTETGSVVLTRGYTSSTLRSVSVNKSGNKITISGTAGNKSHYMCASVVPQTNTTCVGTGTASSANSTYLKSSGTSSTSKTITYTFQSTPPSGTQVVVYTWFTSTSGCTWSASSSAQGKIQTTTLTF